MMTTLKTATHNDIENMANQLKEKLIESVQEILKERAVLDKNGKLLWKKDWWADIEMPKDYPEMIIEMVKHTAKVQTVWELVNVHLVRIGYDIDPQDGQSKLFLMQLI